MPTDQETIERAVLGKRVVAVSWLPLASPEGAFELQSITLEGGIKLNLSSASGHEEVVAEIEENEHADAGDLVDGS